MFFPRRASAAYDAVRSSSAYGLVRGASFKMQGSQVRPLGARRPSPQGSLGSLRWAHCGRCRGDVRFQKSSKAGDTRLARGALCALAPRARASLARPQLCASLRRCTRRSVLRPARSAGAGALLQAPAVAVPGARRRSAPRAPALARRLGRGAAGRRDAPEDRLGGGGPEQARRSAIAARRPRVVRRPGRLQVCVRASARISLCVRNGVP